MPMKIKNGENKGDEVIQVDLMAKCRDPKGNAATQLSHCKSAFTPLLPISSHS
jgi:hypothetical protein